MNWNLEQNKFYHIFGLLLNSFCKVICLIKFIVMCTLQKKYVDLQNQMLNKTNNQLKLLRHRYCYFTTKLSLIVLISILRTAILQPVDTGLIDSTPFVVKRRIYYNNNNNNHFIRDRPQQQQQQDRKQQIATFL